MRAPVRPESTLQQRLAVLFIAFATAFGAFFATPPLPVASAEPQLGGQLYSTGEPVEIEVLPASAGLTSTLYLLEPEEVQIATNRDVGTVVTVGPYGVGEELIFGIRVGVQEYRMGPAERNPDGVIHATVEFLADGCAIVGFEDLFGGGDRDYDDNRFQFCGGIAEAPPDPEPPPDPPPFVPPVADAGDDQSVPEGSVVTLDGTRSTASNLVTRTYTTTADFAEGTSINLTDDPPDQLQLDDTTEAFEFIWIAASARGTVVKIDTVTGEVLGEYWSAPQNRAKDPSRTTVDHNGNVWVGNRAENAFVGSVRKGSATQIGLAENGQCVDRNGNGTIDTSSGLGDIMPWPNSSGADNDGGVDAAADECVITYVRTNGVQIRQVSVDAENHVWVGGAAQGGSPSMFDRIAPGGSIVRTINMRSNADTGESGVVVCCYGGLVDPAGVLWSSSGSNTLLRIDPSKPNGHADLIRITSLGRTSYGLGIDPDGFLWQSNWTFNTVQKITPAGALLNTYTTGGAGNDRGVAVTADGDIWVANSGGSSVSRLENNGTVVAVIPVGQQPTGVAVDAAGKVWATNLSSSTASRIDPATNAVDLTVSLGSGAGPYNYSDMTGSTLTGAPDEGTWSVIHDSESAGTDWAFIDWSAELLGDASLTVTVASSTDGATFSPEVQVADGEPIEGLPDGRYLRITAHFTRSADGDSPVLFDLTVAHKGDLANTLGFLWRLTDSNGPPIFLSSTTSATPSFVAPDDATYTFELTVTDSAGLSDSDETTVIVENRAPELQVESTQGVAGTLTLVSASFTDPGWLDWHTGTIDWGDDTTSDLRVTDGTGWGTAFGSHLYLESGTYPVALTLTDDDGGTSTAATATVDIAEAIAIWANSTTAPDAIDWSGSGVEVRGRTHANKDVKLSGSGNTVDGSFEFVGSFTDGGGGNTYDPPARVAAEPFPLSFNLADYQPGGSAAVAAGEQYFDMSAECSARGKFERDVQGTELPIGLYYAPCDVVFNASNLVGTFTIVSTGKVSVSGSDESLAQPFIDGLLVFTTSSSDDAVKLSGSNSGYSGFVYAPNGRLDVAGSSSRFFCGMFADRIRLTGSDNQIAGGGCTTPAQDTGGTLLVPTIGLELSADVTDALPSEPITYDLAVSNDGATLVVSGLLGAENVDDQAWSVADFRWALETFDVASGDWTELASVEPEGSSGVTLSVQANDATGVSYGAVPFMGTSLEPTGFASWSYEASVPLTPTAVTALLDAAATGGIRVRFDLDFGDPSARVRQLFRFGNDFIEPLRALAGDISDTSLTLLLPTGDPVLVDAAVLPALADLAPGASADLQEIYSVEVPPARRATETDAGYLSRLLILDGAPLVGSAFALAQGGVGRLVAPLVTVTTTEHLPVVSISTVGPEGIPAGTTGSYDLNLANLGSVEAESVDVAADAAGSALHVAGASSVLVAGQLATATTSYDAPSESPPADVTVTGEVTWTDEAGNEYGPVRSAQITPILTAATLSATLVDTLQTDVGGDGQVSPGDTVRYALAVTNHGDLPLTDVVATVAPDPNSALVVGSVVTAGGSVVSGNAAGDSSVEVAMPTVAGESSASLTFDVTVDDPFPSGVSRLDVQGEVAADGFDAVPTDDPALPGMADRTRTTVVVPVANMTAFLSGRLHLDPDANGFPSPGDTLRYELVVNSVGSLPVTGASLTVPTPTGTSLVAGSVTTTAGAVNAGSTVSVDLGTLAPFVSATIGFDLLIASSLPSGMTAVTAQGTVASNDLADLLTDDPNTFAVGDATVIPIGSGPGGDGGGVPGVPGPTIGEVSLAEGAVITEPTDVSATLTPPSGETVTAWTVGYRLTDDAQVTEIASGSGEAVASTLDPTVMPNGSYALVIRGTGSGGGVSIAETAFVVEGNLKLGRFQVTYQDLNVPVGGIPLEVLRTYDSFDKSVGDFGVGWSLELANFRVSTNGPLGEGGWTMFSCGGGFIFVPLCFSSTTPHYVTVTWPDGRVETFDLTPARGTTFLRGLTSAQFTARHGTTSTLQALHSGLYWSNGNLLGGFFGTDGIYDPTQFRLTDKFGTQYLLEVGRGLLSATDRNGNTVTVTNAGIISSLGPSINFTRDAQGRISEISDPAGGDIVYSYNSDGDLASVTDQGGEITEFQYGPGHYLTGVEGSGVPLRTLTYEDGRLASITDGEGNTVAVDIDPDARTETISGPDPRLVTVNSYDERGNLIQVDQVGNGRVLTTHHSYDALGRPIESVDANGGTVTATWDADGNVTRLTDAEGNSWRFEYDAFGQLTALRAGDGSIIESMVYDAAGNLIRREAADGSAYVLTPGSRGLPVRVEDPLGRVSLLSYDAAGQPTRIEGVGGTQEYGYDGLGRITSVTDANESETTYAYDAVGNLTSVTDAAGEQIVYVYDAFHRVVEETDRLGNTSHREYDAAGRLTQLIDRNGAVTTYSYDESGRLVQKSLPGDTVDYTYDPFGRIVRLADGDSAIAFEYDDAGNLISQTTSGTGDADLPTVTLEMAYALNGAPTSVTSPAGTIEYQYDARHRLAHVVDPAGLTHDFTYDAVDRLDTYARPNGVVDDFDFDAVGQLLSRTSQLGAEVLRSFEYTYDLGGRRTSMTAADGQHVYAYDPLGQLLSADHPSGGIPDESFTYDAIGNRLGAPEGAFVHDDAGRLLSDGEHEYTYDAEGNLLRREALAGGSVTTYEWNAQHQLLAVNLPDGSRSTYRYDPLGRRIEVSDAGTVRRYVYFGPNVLLEYDGSNELSISHVVALQAGRVLSSTGGGETVYYLQDGMNSTVAMTDDAGAVIAEFAYDSFGVPIGDEPRTYAFAGLQFDAATGLYYARARYYDPSIGRFISEDPVASINPYAYASNNPIQLVDPHGRATFVEYLGAFRTGAILGGLAYFVGGGVLNLARHRNFTEGMTWHDLIIAMIGGGLTGLPLPFLLSVWTRVLWASVIGFLATYASMLIGGRSSPLELIVGTIFGGLGAKDFGGPGVFGLGRAILASGFLTALQNLINELLEALGSSPSEQLEPT